MKVDCFQAIADPTRRAILTLLLVQSLTPNAISSQFESSRQAVSKHLRILKEADLLTTQQKGREIYYQINPIKLKEMNQWIQQFQFLWETRFSQLDEVLLSLKNKENL